MVYITFSVNIRVSIVDDFYNLVMQVLHRIQSELLRYICRFFLALKLLSILYLNACIKEWNSFFHLQWMLQIPGATSYIGSIGKDKYGEEMKKNAKQAGVNVSYLIALFSFSVVDITTINITTVIFICQLQ